MSAFIKIPFFKKDLLKIRSFVYGEKQNLTRSRLLTLMHCEKQGKL